MNIEKYDQNVLTFPVFEGDFGDPHDKVLRNNMVQARKEHECHHCTGPIQLQERHRCMQGKYDGEMRTFRWCEACCDIMATYFEDSHKGAMLLEKRFEKRHETE